MQAEERRLIYLHNVIIMSILIYVQQIGHLGMVARALALIAHLLFQAITTEHCAPVAPRRDGTNGAPEVIC